MDGKQINIKETKLKLEHKIRASIQYTIKHEHFKKKTFNK